MRKITTEEFIEKSISIFGKKYDYSLVNYQNMKSKVKIIYKDWIFEQKAEDHLLGKLCELRWTTERFIFESRKIHGEKYNYDKVIFKAMNHNVIIILDGVEYEQMPCKHLAGMCPEKVRRMRTNEKFIEDSRNIWGYKYDYSLVDYKGSHTEVMIKYNDKIYYQKPVEHLSGYKCEKSNVQTTEDFIRKSKERHGEKYDYSLSEYKGIQEKVKILYNGILYEQKAGAHLYSSGLVENVIKRKTKEEFIQAAIDTHNNKYKYDKVDYINNQTKVIINCPIHGDFEQRPSSHLQGAGCVNCAESKGEKAIAKFLDKNNISYYRQHKFANCRTTRPLPFDFYIPSIRTAIEFDGEQHFKPNPFFGGLEAYNKLIANDKIKNDYCEDNYIDLVRIRYDQLDNIESYLNEVFRYKK